MDATQTRASAVASRSGFSRTFLATRIDYPTTKPEIPADSVEVNGSPVINYTHFSLTLSGTQKLARWVAWNIDGTKIKLLSRTGISFAKDPRVPEEFQAGNDLYTDNHLDRGHLARRADLTWGTKREATQANKDSFYFTNITPQMDDFNQSRQAGLWGRLENALYEDVELDKLRCSVFGGPVFAATGQRYRGYQIPTEYRKLILFEHEGQLKARAFMLTQDLDRLRVFMALDEFRVYQISVAELEERTGLDFPAAVHQADDLVLAKAEHRAPLDSVSGIRW
ncbi:DNA/RNA non-specific endonuclease [Glutamicibacter soli]|uniref:Endonuclease n=1 Tax=Glutamicibacter soli TaxID=453836 RepID=A0A6L9G849_9MICC|nr:DNA/RNA non-specific endonuclease [Glutamicibacter soli]NAZ17339.1 DNA/RNA non-specific endonuclease [Glutamicibacter soli]